MDMPRNEVRNLRFDEFSVEKHLDHAAQQARARNYQDFLIVDVDSHHHRQPGDPPLRPGQPESRRPLRHVQ
jgi:hypothetical protein